jgi:hypothetical protein
MTAQELDFGPLNTVLADDEEFSIPLDISDIISICREYNKLGSMIQLQVEQILEIGVEEAVKAGAVKQESLPDIKIFLDKICDNPYFGDANLQAKNCLYLIDLFLEKNKINRALN